MAKAPEFGAITRDTMPEAPGWLDKLLLPLNRALVALKASLSRGLTLRENMAGGVYTVDVDVPADGAAAGVWESPVTVSLGASFPGTAAHVLITSAINRETKKAVTCDGCPAWEASSIDGKIPAVRLLQVGGLTALQRYTLTLWVMAG